MTTTKAAPAPARDPAARAARGKAARRSAPIESHAEFVPAADRVDAVTILAGQSAARVPELVPIRYGRMMVSPFTFYRGAAAVMAADLAGTPDSGLYTQLCGDAHLLNFGMFASPERRLIFDINDFDETHSGPWEWDVKRLAASLELAGRENAFDRKSRRQIVRAAVRSYRESMARFAAMRELDVWYSRADLDEVSDMLDKQLSKQRRRKFALARAKARTRDSLQAFRKLTTLVDGERRIVGDPPLIVPVQDMLPDVAREQLEEQIRELFTGYRDSLADDRRRLFDAFRFVDMARKVVGVGSVGTRCWIVLLLGRDDDDPLLLQVKEATVSVLAPHVAEPARRDHGHEGRRVVAGQRLMQAASDIFLGWQTVAGIDGMERDFYVRQLRDWKGAAVVEEMDPDGMQPYGRLCGWTLARAHARTGDRIAIAAYLGEDTAFDQALARFAESYADLTERDHAALGEAARSGRIEVRSGI